MKSMQTFTGVILIVLMIKNFINGTQTHSLILTCTWIIMSTLWHMHGEWKEKGK